MLTSRTDFVTIQARQGKLGNCMGFMNGREPGFMVEVRSLGCAPFPISTNY